MPATIHTHKIASALRNYRLVLVMVLLLQQTTITAQNLLCNGSFDDIPVGSPPAFVTHANMPCWYTSAPDSLFEVWINGFNGIPSYGGSQFIEMNANYQSTIWQEFTAAPSANARLSFAHRGRGGTDSVAVYIATAGGTDSLIGIYGDGGVWGLHTVYFTLPSGSAAFTLKMASYYSALGNITVGNLLDQVALDTGSFIPASDFTTADTSICKSQCINFIDQSTNNPTSWQWLFPGAGVPSSTQQNPTNICYNNPGTYDVTLITCNGAGCDTLNLPSYITVNPDASPVVSFSNDTLFCTPAASYQWYLVPGVLLSGATDSFCLPLQNGGYFVVVTDSNGCTGVSDTLTVNTITPVTLFGCSDSVFCEKHCIDFYDFSTNNPTSWLWLFPGADTLMSTQQNPVNICYSAYGGFDVVLIACNPAGCDTLYMPNFVNVYPAPVPAITSSSDTLFSSPAASYQWWSVDSGLIAGATNNYYIPAYSGSYYVIVTDSNGCNGASNTLVINDIQQLEESVLHILIEPNPNEGYFVIETGHEIIRYHLRIFNSAGQPVFERKNATAGKLKVDLHGNPSGVYGMELITSNRVYRQKLLVQH